ncbi:MAG: acyl-[acyl-carrier-protein] thioesterase [Blautia sp.]
MSYSFGSRVRYSEVGADGYLTLHGVVNYFQDCCIFHSESVGRGVKACDEAKKGWVLSSWQIVIDRLPKLGEEIVARTWPYEFRGFLGYRNFTLDTVEGQRLAYANSLWSFLDAGTGMPIKVTDQDITGYELEEKLDMAYAPRKIKLPQKMEDREEILVRRHHVDTNQHVNNGQYIVMAQEFLPEDFVIGQLRAEYKKSAHLEDTIYPKVSTDLESCVVSLEDEGGSSYCVVQFISKKSR